MISLRGGTAVTQAWVRQQAGLFLCMYLPISFKSSMLLFFDNQNYAFARYWLISNERVRDYGCDSVRAAAEYFSKSCAPGVR